MQKSLGKDNDKELVYLVQPLPQSLLYYVFSFGRIDDIDEKQIKISNIPINELSQIMKKKNSNEILKIQKKVVVKKVVVKKVVKKN